MLSIWNYLSTIWKVAKNNSFKNFGMDKLVGFFNVMFVRWQLLSCESEKQKFQQVCTVIRFSSLAPNGEYMHSRQLRASKLSNRYKFEAGYDCGIYYYSAYFVYTMVCVCYFLFVLANSFPAKVPYAFPETSPVL